MSEPESKTKDTFIRRYTSVAALIDILRRREIVLLDPRWKNHPRPSSLAMRRHHPQVDSRRRFCYS